MSIETYLGFDVGTKRTGVAIANSLTHTANGIGVVENNKNGAINFARFDAIINAHNVDLFVVGLPLNKDGKEQEMTFIAKSFGRKLTSRYKLETVFIDEYLSSSDAKKQLKYNHYHPNAKRGDVDKRSAALILQTWLEDN
ncbi:Putative pre-16S rRNA nuclease YqgF [uncultured Gammaproteobacteria bacterium]|uniref:Holliday junction resolvase RuvX n=1 Tax=thiotrophic endosymbiont of Bathymodiolus puteoserpentis (Logatchev) TaxID=343240 RepID=UPI0010BBE210|nr:Holliday junction resolvase RuvX [thiotrophic endosymbiont of Bathymodiolus puteoserpentis (Logatchev)]CAC9652610.1 Putative pre-16S rRNA nuclease YqgF [uncultured Gammaproteobacteria bacterium]CAC9982664.1 Putative pre-16S rRNA nuclease YqgF [uncultured Gammaproteobacteria bacterium]CAC9993868.1 Putative pre-16S rRNA nuclease Yqg [uncultured Gammaproteobacteria bacterium]SSC10847.1 Putative Holliday junction resolvase YqgF [thiotrophic endosymbiont of Bathymodiolus puteoserpentis (Logatchev